MTTSEVQRILEAWRTEGASPATCNRRLAVLRLAHRLAKLRRRRTAELEALVGDALPLERRPHRAPRAR